ncbi:MAG: hypothetical protein AAGB15_11725, partial [Pseudomonadota bacterium]
LQEALAAILNWRGRMLRRGLFRLLESASNSKALVNQTWIAGTVKNADLTLDFLNQPSIRALQGSKSLIGKWLGPVATWLYELPQNVWAAISANTDKPPKDQRLANMDRMPSAIPQETFSKGLLDTLYKRIETEIQDRIRTVQETATTSIDDAKVRVADAFDRAEAAAIAARQAASAAGHEAPLDDPKTLSDDLVREASALIRPNVAAVEAYAKDIAATADEVLARLDDTIASLPMGDALKAKTRAALKAMAVAEGLKTRFDQVDQLLDGTAKAVTAQIQQLEAVIAETTQEIGDWFDQGMDRVTGWYVRRAKAMLFLTGFVMAMVVNFDIIGYSGQLLRDEQLRERIVAQAEATAAAGNVAGLEVDRQTDLILAALAVNSDRPDIGDTITAGEVIGNVAKIPDETRRTLGLAEGFDPGSADPAVKDASEKAAEAAAKTLDAVFQSMIGAFPQDTNDDGTISDAERQAAITAYVNNIKQTFGQSVDILQTQFGEQGVALGRTCPAPAPDPGAAPAEPTLATQALDTVWSGSVLAKAWSGSWLRETFWQGSLSQCIKQTWEWQAFVSWLLIALGCTLGGQFWFDLLRSAIGVRTAAAGVNSDLKALVGGAKTKSQDKPAP